MHATEKLASKAPITIKNTDVKLPKNLFVFIDTIIVSKKCRVYGFYLILNIFRM